MAGGRPSIFSQDVIDQICERIADGESLRTICGLETMPSRATVFRWLSESKPFQDQYARARESQADTLFDEMLDIADDGSNDWMEVTRRDGSTEEVFNHEHFQRSRLRIDARKWMAGKLRPKKYGEKLEVEANLKGSINVVIGGDA